MAEAVSGRHITGSCSCSARMLFAVTFMLNMLGDLVSSSFKLKLEGKR